MRARLITVLYEDKQGAAPKDFGPHALLLSCLARRTNSSDRFVHKKQVVAVPKKANNKIKKALQQDGERLRKRGHVGIAIDDDEVRPLYKLSQTACKSEVLECIRAGTQVADVFIVLIERNTETLIDACCETLGLATPSSKLSPDERDRIFQRAAAAEPQHLDAICAKVPSFRRLVDAVEKLLPGLVARAGPDCGRWLRIILPGHGGCNADSDHIHLQIRMGGAVYDAAVMVASSHSGPSDVSLASWDGALPTPTWSEGWHDGAALNYLTLGLHSNIFTATPKAQLVQELTAAVEQANHVSIYGTGYGPQGMHLIHRNNGHDGAIVVRPLATTPRFFLFHFADQTF